MSKTLHSHGRTAQEAGDVSILRRACVALLLAVGAAPVAAEVMAPHWTLVGWNDLGMHCMDASYDVFSILPPYNTIHAQLVYPDGSLVTDPASEGIVVTYEGVADPDGVVNVTSVGKTTFWDYVGALFGASLAPDQGLAGFDMPGAGNVARAMRFDVAESWFTGEGIPITPKSDGGHRSAYPMFRLVARGSSGELLAETSIVLPVSDEMSCKTCHSSGSSAAAMPPSGWVWDSNPERDYRRNVLRLHDDLDLASPSYQQALAAGGYLATGLAATAAAGTPILCARCHGSNALPGTGLPNVAPLTESVHARHASVIDPRTGLPLDSTLNRSACYTCHPGSTTRCLRGAMGKAVATSGDLAIQCQSCHGGMSRVGSAGRVGWLEQPSCQQCHTGTATHNNGLIRYTTAFEPGGAPRVAVDSTFATEPNRPMPGFDLYRFSYGHGGLACEACHGSTHAEFPALHRNDNLQSEAIQGHVGMLAECAACHGGGVPPGALGGPHGLHRIGPAWIGQHGDVADSQGTAVCRSCHGGDARGTVLSVSQADWIAATGEYGNKHFWKGFRIGCYACHNGPSSESPSPNHPAQVADRTLGTASGVPASITLSASDSDGDPVTLRFVDQPEHGRVGWQGGQATFWPDPGYWGVDRFTYAAWDGWTDSNLGTVTLTVEHASCPTSICLFADDFESADTSAWWLTEP
ncbi:MAG: hypothetical protein KDB94_01980 [Acidobacteria bacterium]|nr:hypothetical protein [Acidobacteriota bacterium]